MSKSAVNSADFTEKATGERQRDFGNLVTAEPTLGFTLIELLVVVAIIALLAGLLFPVLSKTRQQGTSASCMNNLMQIGKAKAMYANEYEYYMPCYASDVGMANAGKLWLGYRQNPLVDLSNGFITPYLSNNTQVLICPGRKKNNVDTDRIVTRGGGYGYNVGVGTWLYLTASNYGSGAGLKLGQVATPVSTIAVGDSCNARNSTVLEEQPFLYPHFSPAMDGGDPETLKKTVFSAVLQNGDNILFRHNRAANILWLDGHATLEVPTRLKPNDLARKEFIGSFGPQDNSLFDPWDL